VSGRGAALDLRTYRLKPGAGETFGRIVREVLPLLTRGHRDKVLALLDSHHVLLPAQAIHDVLSG
jgi:hypothetical protein